MDFPEELLAEILFHLRADATSFRDLRVAFTCKDLYREFGPLVKQRQTALLLDALDRGSLAIWGQTGSWEDGKKAFRQSLQREDQDRQEAFFDTRKNLMLFVRSSGDVDLVWSLHGHLQQYQKLGRPIFDCLTLKLQSARVESNFSFSPGTTYAQFLEAMVEEDKLSLVHWGTAEDQERLAYALRGFSLLAAALVENDMAIYDELCARFEEPDLTLADLKALAQASPIPNAQVSKLVFARVPSPRIFPIQNADAVIRGSSTSLKELQLVDCFSRDMPDELWDAILHRWTFTQLNQLTLKHIDIPLAPLVSFLQRNQSITEVSLMLASFPSIPAERLQCSYIRRLAATPEVLLPLLRDAAVTFPHLELLRIGQDAVKTDRYPIFGYCTLDDVTTILSCIPKTAPSVHTLQLNLAYHPGELHAWLDTAAPPPPPALGTPDGEASDGGAANTAKPSPLLEALRALHQITSLDLTVSEDPRKGGMSLCVWPPYIYIKPGPVMDFVAAFPALKAVRPLNLFYRPCAPGEPSRASYDDFWPEVARVWVKAGSALERVEIDGIGTDSRQEAAVWVRGEAEPVGGFAAYPVAGERIYNMGTLGFA